MFSLAEMRFRARDGRFWKQFALGSVAGYVYAIFGFAAMFGVLGFVDTTIRYPPDSVFWGVAGFILTVPHLIVMAFLVGIIMGVLPILTMLPLATVAALGLQTRKAGTIITGAVLGALIGGPVTLGRMIEKASDGVVVAGSAGAGAMFSLALWQFCLRHYNARNETPASGRFMRWWRSSGLVTKVATVIAGVVVVAFFL